MAPVTRLLTLTTIILASSSGRVFRANNGRHVFMTSHDRPTSGRRVFALPRVSMSGDSSELLAGARARRKPCLIRRLRLREARPRHRRTTEPPQVRLPTIVPADPSTQRSSPNQASVGRVPVHSAHQRVRVPFISRHRQLQRPIARAWRSLRGRRRVRLARRAAHRSKARRTAPPRPRVLSAARDDAIARSVVAAPPRT